MPIDTLGREKESRKEREPELRFEEKDAVDNRKDSMVQELQYRLEHGEFDSFDEVRNAVADFPVDDTAGIDLRTDDEISLIENFADDFGIAIERIVPDNIRRVIEKTATLVIHYLAENAVMKSIDELESFMSEHDLEFSNIVDGNTHGWARHWGERQEGEHCQVYEYRNLEHEQIHIDIWEYKGDGWDLCFEVYLEPSEVSEEENCWDSC